MVHVASRDTSKSANQEILEKEHARLDHDHDVLPRCRHIVEITQACINRGIFPDGSEVREIPYAIMKEARETLIYQRHRHIIGGGGREV